jgi:hypothetical protein
VFTDKHQGRHGRFATGHDLNLTRRQTSHFTSTASYMDPMGLCDSEGSSSTKSVINQRSHQALVVVPFWVACTASVLPRIPLGMY